MFGGFQPTAFQPNAYQNTAVAPSQFGYAIVVALSQTGVQAARSAYLVGSACFVTATFYDSFGNLFTPSALQYSVDDMLSGKTIVPWTPISPADEVQVTITSAQNQFVSFTRPFEDHQCVFMITDGFGDVNFARVLFDLIRIPPPAVTPLT